VTRFSAPITNTQETSNLSQRKTEALSISHKRQAA